MFVFAVYEPVLNKFIVNICSCPPPLFMLSELTTAMRDKVFVGNQQAINFLEFCSQTQCLTNIHSALVFQLFKVLTVTVARKNYTKDLSNVSDRMTNKEFCYVKVIYLVNTCF